MNIHDLHVLNIEGSCGDLVEEQKCYSICTN